MSVDPQFEIEVQVISQAVEDMDYFQILKLSQESSAGELKKAYYRESRLYHPDRYYHLPASPLKTQIDKIYKRITEAYTVLRDPEKRGQYLEGINGPDRESKLRYTEASEADQKQQAYEREGKTPQARQAFKAAQADMAAERWEAAVRNLKTAIMYDSENPYFKEQLTLATEKAKAGGGGGGPSGGGYKIG